MAIIKNQLTESGRALQSEDLSGVHRRPHQSGIPQTAPSDPISALQLGKGVYVGPPSLARARASLRLAIPDPGSKFEQDAEWCLVQQADGSWIEYRFHDYDRIFCVPGLYEKIYYDVLGCDTPAFMAGLLRKALAETGDGAHDIRVLDLGAGNGIMAETLSTIGITYAVGVDILPEAHAAAERDRPGVYTDYVVADLTSLPASPSRTLTEHHLNMLTVVAALGFGDIPPEAFITAYNHALDDGWIVLTIKDKFLADDDTSGFAHKISRGIDNGALEMVKRERFVHRLATDGTPVVYEGIVARKLGALV